MTRSAVLQQGGHVAHGFPEGLDRMNVAQAEAWLERAIEVTTSPCQQPISVAVTCWWLNSSCSQIHTASQCSLVLSPLTMATKEETDSPNGSAKREGDTVPYSDEKRPKHTEEKPEDWKEQTRFYGTQAYAEERSHAEERSDAEPNGGPQGGGPQGGPTPSERRRAAERRHAEVLTELRRRTEVLIERGRRE